jgi:hypothetical protein
VEISEKRNRSNYCNNIGNCIQLLLVVVELYDEVVMTNMMNHDPGKNDYFTIDIYNRPFHYRNSHFYQK